MELCTRFKYSLISLLALSGSVQASADASLAARYQAAVADAKVATVNEVSRDLVAISHNTPELVWSADSASVLMLTWTGWDGYDSEVGQPVTLQREVWVTPAPYLQEFCKAERSQLSDEALTLRLEQLMGLPPHNGKTRFVEMWVKAADLFRPSPDPAITDHEAELDFPVATGMTVSQSHIDWINNLKANSYGENGYPWTRLGYTYDWGDDTPIGLSEFVVQQKAVVTVKGVKKIGDYCGL